MNNVKLLHHDIRTNRRYRLDIELKNGDNKKAIQLIMMNPSEANEEISDNTINRVIKYVSTNNSEGILQDIGKIIFTNLYVVYETYSDNVDNYISEYGLDFVKGIEADGKYNNNMIIKEATNESEIIIIAWGKGDILGYDNRIQEVFSLIKNKEIYHVKDFTEDGYPRHPRNWSYSWTLNKYYT